MKIYRVGYYSDQASSEGFEFFASKRQAKVALSNHLKLKTDDGRSCVDCYDVELSKRGLLEILNIVASKPHNG